MGYKMKVALHSDLHLEGNKPPEDFLVISDYDVLVLAGDIVSSRTVGRLMAIKEAADNKPVIYVPGNHEYYGSGFDEVEASLRNACEVLGFIYANNTVVRLNNKVSFICSTGWSTLESFTEFTEEEKKHEVENGVADFRMIADHTVDKMISRGKRDLNFIEKSLLVTKQEHPDDIVVVVTHFAPTEAHGNERFAPSPLSSYFSNKLEDIMYEHEPHYWMYGHTHGTSERDVYHTKICCNQRGYGLECKNTYNPNRIIELKER